MWSTCISSTSTSSTVITFQKGSKTQFLTLFSVSSILEIINTIFQENIWLYISVGCCWFFYKENTVDEMEENEMGVDEMGSRRSDN